MKRNVFLSCPKNGKILKFSLNNCLFYAPNRIIINKNLQIKIFNLKFIKRRLNDKKSN